MTSVIWKTTLEPKHRQVVSLPKGANILCVGNQNELICLWFQCDPVQGEDRVIVIVGTGHEINFDGKYIGTCFMQGGMFVYHVFEAATI